MRKLKFLGCFLLVVLLVGGTALVAWRAIVGPKYTAKAYLEIARSAPHFLSQSADKYDPAEFESYCNAQKALVKSHYVIRAALRDPRLKNRACVVREDARHNAIAWLTDTISVDLNEQNAGIMVVSANQASAEDAAAIVNAVVDAYMNEGVNLETQKGRNRLTELQRIAAEKENEVRTKKEQLKREIEQLGGVDGEQANAARLQ